MVKVLERCFVDENKDDEYFKKYLKLSWNFANKYTELDKLKKDFEFKNLKDYNLKSKNFEIL